MDDNAFLRDVGDQLRCDRARAEAISFVVFRELRDRLPAKEAADVAAQLPTGLRRFWESDPVKGPVEKTHEFEFIGRVRRFAVLPDRIEAERAVRAVFAALQRLLGSPTGKEGEAWDVFSVLPKDLKMLWLSAQEKS